MSFLHNIVSIIVDSILILSRQNIDHYNIQCHCIINAFNIIWIIMACRYILHSIHIWANLFEAIQPKGEGELLDLVSSPSFSSVGNLDWFFTLL